MHEFCPTRYGDVRTQPNLQMMGFTPLVHRFATILVPLTSSRLCSTQDIPHFVLYKTPLRSATDSASPLWTSLWAPKTVGDCNTASSQLKNHSSRMPLPGKIASALRRSPGMYWDSHWFTRCVDLQGDIIGATNRRVAPSTAQNADATISRSCPAFSSTLVCRWYLF